MTVETRADLTERLQEAAAAAIADVAPGIEAAGPRLRLLTVEVEVDGKGRVTGATAWLQNQINVNKLLAVGRG